VGGEHVPSAGMYGFMEGFAIKRIVGLLLFVCFCDARRQTQGLVPSRQLSTTEPHSQPEICHWDGEKWARTEDHRVRGGLYI
jgi:hypothetical protein